MDFIMLIVCSITMFIFIICNLYDINKWKEVSKSVPVKYQIIKAFKKNKRTEEPDFSKAVYFLIRLENGEEKIIRKQDYVSANQKEIYVQSDGKNYQMYSEYKSFREKEYGIAMLRPSRKSVIVFILCAIICFLSIGYAYEQKYSSERKHLQQIREMKIDQFREDFKAYSSEVTTIFNLFMVMAVDDGLISDDSSINAYLQNIYLCDAALMWINESDSIATPPNTYNHFVKWVYEEKYNHAETYIRCLQDYKNGNITKEEAVKIAEDTEESFLQIADRVMIIAAVTYGLSVIGQIAFVVFLTRIIIYYFGKRKYVAQIRR